MSVAIMNNMTGSTWHHGSTNGFASSRRSKTCWASKASNGGLSDEKAPYRSAKSVLYLGARAAREISVRQRRRRTDPALRRRTQRSEEHTSELQSLMRSSYACFCLNKKREYTITPIIRPITNSHH